MNQEYFDKVTELEKMNASDQYVLGWQEGYQGAPEVEEQRLTDAYEAGYEDGKNNNFDSVAFSIFPSEMSDVMRVADNNLTMPPKSTWFDPKPLDGLVVYEFN